jgi:DNA-binding MarR family transcriptional regulator
MAANRTRSSDGTGELAAALDAIRRIVQVLRISSRTAEQQLGVSGAQLFVLHVLAESPADSLNDLAARTFTHQSSVSVVVERLVRRRLVTRTRSTEDARRVTLAITPAGRALLRDAPQLAQLQLIDALRALPTRDRRALTRTLDRLIQQMGVQGTTPMLFEDDVARRTTGAPRPSRPRRSERQR